MERILHLAAADLIDERPDGSDEDVHFPQALAHAVIDSYSSPGETVLDPFAGWGTTLVVAEKLGRRAVGVELVPERVAAIKQLVSSAAVVLEADARNLDSLRLGQIDLCFTSPPYMSAVEHPHECVKFGWPHVSVFGWLRLVSACGTMWRCGYGPCPIWWTS